MKNIMKDSLLLNTGANSGFKVKRCWDDDVEFKNYARGDRGQSTEVPPKKTASNQVPTKSVFVHRKKKDKTVTNRTHLVSYAWKIRKKITGGRCGVETE